MDNPLDSCVVTVTLVGSVHTHLPSQAVPQVSHEAPGDPSPLVTEMSYMMPSY